MSVSYLELAHTRLCDASLLKRSEHKLVHRSRCHAVRVVGHTAHLWGLAGRERRPVLEPASLGVVRCVLHHVSRALGVEGPERWVNDEPRVVGRS
jgi:hypothetical protein